MNDQPLKLRETIGYGLIGLSLFLGIWTLLSVSGWVPRPFLPAPFDVIARFVQLLTTPFAGATLPQHLASSFQRYLCGMVLAAVIGIPLGLLMGWFRWLDDIVSPIFEGLRFIAPIAWVPFAALWFGTGIGGPVMIIFAGAFPPCLINAYRGARFVDPHLIEASQMLGTGHLRAIVEVLLPASGS
jgi:ABC-type nitrate/sulfonate/bicarbonate transport system permease component